MLTLCRPILLHFEMSSPSQKRDWEQAIAEETLCVSDETGLVGTESFRVLKLLRSGSFKKKTNASVWEQAFEFQRGVGFQSVDSSEHSAKQTTTKTPFKNDKHIRQMPHPIPRDWLNDPLVFHRCELAIDDKAKNKQFSRKAFLF